MGLPGETVTANTNRVKKQGEDLEKIKVNGLGWMKLGQGKTPGSGQTFVSLGSQQKGP